MKLAKRSIFVVGIKKLKASLYQCDDVERGGLIFSCIVNNDGSFYRDLMSLFSLISVHLFYEHFVFLSNQLSYNGRYYNPNHEDTHTFISYECNLRFHTSHQEDPLSFPLHKKIRYYRTKASNDTLGIS